MARVALPSVALLLTVLGCSGDPEVAVPPDGAVVRFVPASGGAPAFGDVPFPSDLYRDARGGVSVGTSGLERIASAGQRILSDGLSDLDGFGRTSTAIFFVDGAVDPASLPGSHKDSLFDGASVALVDVDPDSDRLGTRYPVSARWFPSLSCLTVLPLPGTVLPAGVRHAFVLGRALRDAKGRSLTADVALKAAIARHGDALHADAIDVLVTRGVVRRATDIAGLAVFTTSRRAEELGVLRNRLDAEFPAPTVDWTTAYAPLAVARFATSTTPSLDDWLGTPDVDETGKQWPGGDSPSGVAHDQIGAVVTGSLPSPYFIDTATHHFARDATGAYAVQGAAARIPITMIVPKSPPPASGYPVIINGHGLSNHRGSMLGVANEFARAGFVTLGTDDVAHGARVGIADDKNNFPGSYAGPDGIPDMGGIPVTFFAGFTDFVAVRDNFRQTILDQISLVRLIRNPALDLSELSPLLGGSAPRLDPTRIFWSGGSLGGIVGSMVIGVEPRIRAAALQVPGAGFVQFIATESAQLHTLVLQIAGTTFGIVSEEAVDEYHPVAALLGQIAEAGDPLAYAPAVYGTPLVADDDGQPTHVLVTYSIDDEVLPNVATQALIRALGIPITGTTLAEPDDIALLAAPASGNLGANGATGAAVQYAPSTHALGYNRFDIRQYLPGFPRAEDPRFPALAKTIRIELPVREHQRQVTSFFTSVLAGHPQIDQPKPPVLDFDGDGVLDADEATAGTDPLDPASH